MALSQGYRPRFINGNWWLETRGGYPMIGPVLPQLRSGVLVGFEVINDGRPGPVDPVDPTGIDRSALVALYGTYYPSTDPTDYTKNTCGSSIRMADLDEYNAPGTLEVSITDYTTIQNKIVYGRIRPNGSTRARLETENCILMGPPNASRYTGETAICDWNGAAAAEQSHFLDTTIWPQFTHPRQNAFKGSRHKIERCDIHGVTDGAGPYSTPGTSNPTAFDMTASKVDNLVNWPGKYFANAATSYWNGTAYQPGTSGAILRTSADYRFMDDQHNDSTHNDAIEIHGGYGNHTWDGTKYVPVSTNGGGVHIRGNVLFARDAYDLVGDPTGLGLPAFDKGDGDNPKRYITGGGQKPGMARPYTSWAGVDDGGRYIGNGSAIIVTQLENQFPSDTTVVIYDNLMDWGSIGLQEQRKAYASLQMRVFDNEFGAHWQRWGGGNVPGPTGPTGDIYPMRLYDGAAPNGNTAALTIGLNPRDGQPGLFSNTWQDPDQRWGRDGLPLIYGKATGIRT